MDQRILFVALGVAALAFASLAFASGGNGWTAAGFGPQDWNGTRPMPPGGWNGTFRGHGMMRGFDGNETRMQNQTARAETMKQFQQAVLSGDYATAKNLSATYGFGGPMFGKLNESTFAKYSQIAALESQLRQELGLNATGMMPPLLEKPGFANRPGMKSGLGMMGPEFAKGMRQGFRKGASQGNNQTTQQ